MRFLTWDSGILVALGLLLAYSLLIRKHKSLATLVGLYVGYVMATVVGPQISEFFSGDRVFLGQVWINANASLFMVKTLVLVGIALLLSSFMKLGGKRSHYSSLEVVVYAILAVALGITFLLSFMEPGMRSAVIHNSLIIPWVDRFHQWLVVAPVFLIILFGALGNADE